MSRIPGRALAFALLGLTCLSSPICADQVFQVSGTLIAIGNSVPSCPPAACAEIIDFSFTVTPTIGISGDTELSTSLESLKESGPLTLGFADGGLMGPTFGDYFLGGNGDEIDLGYTVDQIGGGFDFSLGGAFFYACTSATCLTDFTSNGMPCVGPLCPDRAEVEVVDASVSQVAEPSTRLLLAFTAAGLFLVFRLKLKGLYAEAARAHRRASVTFS